MVITHTGDREPTTGTDGDGRQALPTDPAQPSRPVRRSWGEGTRTRAIELEALWREMFRQRGRPSELADLDKATRRHLAAARNAAELLNRGRWRWRDGPLLECAISNLDAAEANLLQIASPEYLLGQLPCLLNQAQRHLTQDDPRRRDLEAIVRDLTGQVTVFPASDGTGPAGPGRADADGKADQQATVAEAIPSVLHTRPRPLAEKRAIVVAERSRIASIARAASSAGMREQLRVRSFRNVVIAVTAMTFALAVLLAVAGYLKPTLFPICFQPEQSGQTIVVCPTGPSQAVPPQPGTGPMQPQVDLVVPKTVQPWDVAVVELLGAVSAAVVGAASLRGLRGSSEPHALPVALAALKLPTGALTAMLGLLLMRGGFVPGLSALDTPGQILAWAILFGGAQQLFTRLVDQQAHTVLDGVRGSRNVASAPTSAPS